MLFTSDPPCTQEKDTAMGCCQLFGSAFHRSNIPQILTLMKFSLELSDPWISQYYSSRDPGGLELFQKRRKLHQLWITDNDNELRKLMLNASTLQHLEGWR